MANTTFSGPVRSENGFDFVTKNATTGAFTTNASYDKGITGGVQSLSGAGAVDIVNLVTEVTTTGADALTLADGTVGQIKIITMIVDGGNGTLTPTTGAFTTNASYDKGITGGVQSLSGAGAVDIVNLVTEVTTTGADALTLADGTVGQIKIITMIVDGGNGTLTPTTFANGTNITFDAVNETVCLLFANTIGWVVVSNSGATVA